MTPMNHILALRIHRETCAQAALEAQRKVCVQASADRETAADALETFTQMASTHEKSLARALLGKTVRLREISAFNLEVADLRQQMQRLAQALQEASRICDQASLAVRECEVVHTVAWRQQQTFASLVSAEASRVAGEREARQEREIEEAGEYARPPAGLEAGWRRAND